MKKSLKWRLSSLPTPDEVRELVKDKIITKEEARSILFNLTDGKEAEELKSEIKFLREIIEKLSENKVTQLIEIIKEVQHPYWNRQPFYQPYYQWCSTGSGSGSVTSTSQNAAYLSTDADATISMSSTLDSNQDNFSSINTFS